MGNYQFYPYEGKPYSKLYKYYSNLDYAIDVIENQRVHLENPSSYNDIYECKQRFTEDSLKLYQCTRKIAYEKLDSKYHSALDVVQFQIPESETLRPPIFSFFELINLLCDAVPTIDRAELVRECTTKLFGTGLLNTGFVKMSCFSERNDSILMWAYYANSYSGICLEFDIAADEFLASKCRKVQYSRHFPSGDFDGDNFFRKGEEWSHEQEWRIVCTTKEEFLPTTSLRSIIIGPRTPVEDIKRLIPYVDKNKLILSQVTLSDSEYRLIIRPVCDFSDLEEK